MVKFMIIFHHPGADVTEFEAGYARFLGMVEQIPNITRRQVVTVLGSPEGESKYYRILELYFDSQQTMTAALNTEAGQIAGAGLYEVFRPLGYEFDTAFADVFEEAGGATPHTGESNTP
ncbi:MAG: EthD family reductase [Chloroflexota bacterium]